MLSLISPVTAIVLKVNNLNPFILMELIKVSLEFKLEITNYNLINTSFQPHILRPDYIFILNATFICRCCNARKRLPSSRYAEDIVHSVRCLELPCNNIQTVADKTARRMCSVLNNLCDAILHLLFMLNSSSLQW